MKELATTNNVMPPRDGAVARAHSYWLAVALALASFPMHACNDTTANGNAGDGLRVRNACETREDCRLRVGDASPTDICFLGHCTDPVAAAPCNGDCGLGATCVRSGILAHCDGCTSDSACVSPGPMCELITGHPCVPDNPDSSVPLDPPPPPRIHDAGHG
jgi:hypothetical protein